MKTALLIALALAAAPAAAHASDWTVTGSMRLRQEWYRDTVRPGFNADDTTTSIRTTLFAERKLGAVRLGGEIYDSRVYGADRRTPITSNDVNTLELVQAYAAVDWNTQALGKVTVEAGRLLLNLGSRRLVAADDYRNTTSSAQGVRVDLHPAGVETTLIYVQPFNRLPEAIGALVDNTHRPDHAGSDQVFWGGIASRRDTVAGAMLEGAYYRLDERDIAGRATRDRRLDTMSARLLRDPKPGRLDFEIEAISQTGGISASTAPGAPRQAVRAGFLHADGGYTWDAPWRPRLSAEFDIATGDRPGAKRFERFDTLYGMRRADLGPSGIYAVLGRTNLATPGLRLELAPRGRWDAFGSVRGMWLASATDAFSTSGVRDAAGASGRFAGYQLDGRVRYWLVPDRLRLEVNGAWLDKGRFLRVAPNATRTGDMSYLSVALTGRF